MKMQSNVKKCMIQANGVLKTPIGKPRIKPAKPFYLKE
jgi:hypothetical protein